MTIGAIRARLERHRFGTLSSEDRRRYATFMAGMLRRYETLLYQTRIGNMSRSDWEGSFAELRTTFKYPGARAWWSNANPIFSSDLRSLVANELLGPEPRDPAT